MPKCAMGNSVGGVFMALAIACLIIGVILLIIAILLYQGATQVLSQKLKLCKI